MVSMDTDTDMDTVQQVPIADHLNQLQISDRCFEYLTPQDKGNGDERWVVTKAKVRFISKNPPLYQVLDVPPHGDDSDYVPEGYNWVEAAFFGAENQFHIISNNVYVLVEYQPGSAPVQILDGPCYSFNRFWSLSYTDFDCYSLKGAFNCGENEVFLFGGGCWGRIKYNPANQLCDRGDKFIEGPMSFEAMFPCFKDFRLFHEIKSGFPLPDTTQAYVFQGEMYALIDYAGTPKERKVLHHGYVYELFPCLDETIFYEVGIQAAFYSCTKDGLCVVYIFAGKYYAKIYKDWPCLLPFKPWCQVSKLQPHLQGNPSVLLMEYDYDY